MAYFDDRIHRTDELFHQNCGHELELRRRLERDSHAVGAHFHSVLEQLAMTNGLSPFHDLERERREIVGVQPR